MMKENHHLNRERERPRNHYVKAESEIVRKCYFMYTVNVSQPDACARFTTTFCPPPPSADTYVWNAVDFNCIVDPSLEQAQEN